jgi:hypothetical protein
LAPNTGAAPGVRRDPVEIHHMRKSALLVSLLLAAGVASANSCPTHMKKIDEALAKKPTLSAAQMDEVKKYRTEGEAMHKAGKHKESEEALAKAEKILGVK